MSFFTRSLMSLLICMFIIDVSVKANSGTGTPDTTNLYYSLDSCEAYIIAGTVRDYSEFTAELSDQSDCVQVIPIGTVHRRNPNVNRHSCTPGVDGDLAMCVSADDSCEFTEDHDKALRFEFLVSALGEDTVRLSSLNFFEQSPLNYFWIDGPNGVNNYPSSFGVRILKDGNEIYRATDVPSSNTWAFNEFRLDDIAGSVITGNSVITVELLAYCPTDNGGEVSVWDIDEISFSIICSPPTLDPTQICFSDGSKEANICAEDEIPDIFSIISSAVTNDSLVFVISDSNGTILDILFNSIIDLTPYGSSGTCFIQQINYQGDLTGLVLNGRLSDVTGCFAVSNQLIVNHNSVTPTVISFQDGSNTLDVCLTESLDFEISPLISGQDTFSNTWIVTDESGNILALSQNLPLVFTNASPGFCLIWNVSYSGEILNLQEGNNIEDLDGCYALSNSLRVNKLNAVGGQISINGATEIEVCANPNSQGLELSPELAGNQGSGSVWLVTDLMLNIQSVYVSSSFILDSSLDTCLLWHVAFEGNLQGLGQGLNAAGLFGCYDLSNSVQIIKIRTEAPAISFRGSDVLEICDEPGLWSSFGPDIEDYAGDSLVWLITDTNNIIQEIGLELPLDLSSYVPGQCRVYALVYSDALTGLSIGTSVSDLDGDCLAISNSIQIEKNLVEGGDLSYNGQTEVELCDDGGPGIQVEVELQSELGNFSSFLLANTQGQVLNVFYSPQIDISFTSDTCVVYHMASSENPLGITSGQFISDFGFCYELSNALVFVKKSVQGGEVTSVQGTTDINICASAGESLELDVVLQNNSGDSQVWVITDTTGFIVQVPIGPPFDLSGLASGNYRIYSVNYNSSVSGLSSGQLLSDISGDCFEISSFLELKIVYVDGGTISSDQGDRIEVCIGLTELDAINVHLEDSEGESSIWLLASNEGEIIQFLPDPPIDVNALNADSCLVYHLSFTNNLLGLAPGFNIADLEGCFDLSNSIEIIKKNITGGMLDSELGQSATICVGDGNPDLVNFSVSASNGTNNLLVLTDNDNRIISVLPGTEFDFENSSEGICLVQNISYEGFISGASPGALLSEIDGCFAISNSVQITKISNNAGTISGGPGAGVSICLADDIEDEYQFNVSGQSGENFAWLLTTEGGIILEINDSGLFDFTNSTLSRCLVWHLAYSSGITGLEVSSSASELDGCFDLSESILIEKQNPEGGELTSELGSEILICLSGSESTQVVFDVNGNSGNFSQLISTDLNGIINGIYNTDTIDFSNSASGSCLIWNLSYNELPSGLEIGNHVDVLNGCYDLSNSIEITRINAVGGTVSSSIGDSLTICAGDGISDLLSFSISGNEGESAVWLLTDLSARILAIGDFSTIELDENIAYERLLWHLSYSSVINGLEIGQLATDLDGCYALSNSIYIRALKFEGGNLSVNASTSAEVCLNDLTTHNVDFSLENSNGQFNQLIVTDTSGIILELHDNLTIDFSGSTDGICLVWNISYDVLPASLEPGGSIDSLNGCFALSNAVEITKFTKDAGSISVGGKTVIGICSGDGQADLISPEKTGGSESGNSVWLVTRTDLRIIDIKTSLPIDFENTAGDTCLLWFVCYEGILTGLQTNSSAADLGGCFDLSNPITIVKSEYEDVISTSSMMWFDFDDCYSDTEDFSNQDYSEFTAEIMNDRSCVNYSLVGDNLYRNNPELNFHSCTEGVNGLAMCVGSLDDCNYAADSDKAVRFSVLMSPGPSGFGNLGSLSLFEQAPVRYNWINGPGGLNNYPELWALRILKNGEEIYLETDIPTSANWHKHEFDFTDSLMFYFSESTVFEFELTAYCLTGNGAEVNAWDLDELKLSTDCLSGLVPGVISTADGTDEAEVCVEEGIFQPVDVQVLQASGDFTRWVVTDLDGNILDFPVNNPIDFTGYPAGSCLIWYVSYSRGLQCLEEGFNIHTDLMGCYELSNSIRVDKLDGDDCEDVGGIAEENEDEEKQQLIKDFSISPNPVSDWLLIQFDEQPDHELKILVYDYSGTLLDSKQVTSRDYKLRTMDYSNGLYYIQVVSRNWKSQKKFIKF